MVHEEISFDGLNNMFMPLQRALDGVEGICTQDLSLMQLSNKLAVTLVKVLSS